MQNPSCSESTSSSHDQSRGHTSSKQLTCEVCGKYFNQKSDLTRHLKIHTGDKPFTCSVSGKSFIQKNVAVKHLRVPTGEKPFACSEFGKCFSRKRSRRNREKTPAFEGPFACSECGKCFKYKSYLRLHERTHVIEKPLCHNKSWDDYKDKFFLKISGQFQHDQEKSSFIETEKCISVCNCTENRNVPVGEKSHICGKCGKTSAFEGSSDYQEKSHLCVSYCKLCGEGFKECRCHNQAYHTSSQELDDVKNVNLLEDTGKELHEGVSVKDEIDIDEISSKSQVSEEFEFIFVKSELESD